MNKERILALAELIEKQPKTSYFEQVGFNMGQLTHDCGTPSCIAGWAAWVAQGEPEKVHETKDDWSIENQAAEFMGLPPVNDEAGVSEDHTFRLFYPVGVDFTSITPEHAAFTLRHLAETGNVDWSAYEVPHV